MPDKQIQAVTEFVMVDPQVGGIGIAAGASLSDTVVMLESGHGTAAEYTGKEQVNPGSIILSAAMRRGFATWAARKPLLEWLRACPASLPQAACSMSWNDAKPPGLWRGHYHAHGLSQKK